VGKLPGVTITSNSGAPGNTSTIRIRGTTSINASSDPLIVIDNVPVSNVITGGTSNILAAINPNDVEKYHRAERCICHRHLRFKRI
jgi:outer membrane cobalamin receptor